MKTRPTLPCSPKRRAYLPLLAVALMGLLCLAANVVAQEPMTYFHVMGTGDPTPADPNDPPVETGPTIEACDVGALMESGFMAYVCSFDGDKNSDGGVYYPSGEKPYRSFRREVPLPGQRVGFEIAIIPFGIPALHPVTGDTYVTAFFDRIPDIEPARASSHPNRPGGRQEGVYVYRREAKVMERIADTTVGSPPPPGQKALWTDFSNNVVVSPAGAFFVGSYRSQSGGPAGQAIYGYVDGKLEELVGASTKVSGRSMSFSSFRGLAANAEAVFFVGETGACVEGDPKSCLRGIYAYDLKSALVSPVIESGAPADGGAFEDFAIEPKSGIFHHSIAANSAGDIVVVASFRLGDALSQGVFLLKRVAGEYQPTPILRLGDEAGESLLCSEIDSFNTVAINERGELAFTVAYTGKAAAEQGLVFYQEAKGLQSVFKKGDTFLADLRHGSEATSGHGGMVAGSQALDSSLPPKIIFRHAYVAQNKVQSMMVLAVLGEVESSGGQAGVTPTPEARACPESKRATR